MVSKLSCYYDGLATSPSRLYMAWSWLCSLSGWLLSSLCVCHSAFLGLTVLHYLVLKAFTLKMHTVPILKKGENWHYSVLSSANWTLAFKKCNYNSGNYIWRWFETGFLPTSSISSVQLLSRVWLFGIPWIPARQASLSITNSQSSLKLASIQAVMPSSHLILCRPLLLLPPIPPSIRVFSNESTLHMRWPKY